MASVTMRSMTTTRRSTDAPAKRPRELFPRGRAPGCTERVTDGQRGTVAKVHLVMRGLPRGGWLGVGLIIGLVIGLLLPWAW
jgi:hypothetical protein